MANTECLATVCPYFLRLLFRRRLLDILRKRRATRVAAAPYEPTRRLPLRPGQACKIYPLELLGLDHRIVAGLFRRFRELAPDEIALTRPQVQQAFVVLAGN